MERLNYVLQTDNLAIAVTDPTTEMPDWKTMHSSHVSFKSIVRALKREDWSRALRLFDTAQLIADKSQGKVQVKKDGVFYNGTLLNNSLTSRILNLIKEGKSVSHMLKFMDRLYLNPSQDAINELFDWLNGCKLPITDDGRFVAYKRVRSDYKDVHSGTIDYSVGQIVFMKRSDVCPNRDNHCAEGLHFCSVAYLPSYPGDRVMQVLIDPADVVSIPSDYSFTKGRTWQLEVVKEIAKDQITDLIDRGVDIDEYRVAVYSISKERKKLVADILALPTVKAMLRKAKKVRRVKKGRKAKKAAFLVSEKSIRKMTYGRLVNLYKQFAPPEPSTFPVGTFFDELTGRNRLHRMRKAYGFTIGQVAEKMKVVYRTVYNYEIARALPQATIDEYIDALMRLSRLGDSTQTGLSFPKPTLTKREAAVAAAASTVVEDDHNEIGGDEVEEGDFVEEHDDWDESNGWEEDYEEEEEEEEENW